MTSQFEPFAAKSIADHEIQVLYRIDGVSISSGPQVRLFQLAEGPGVPADQTPALAGRYGQAAVWKRDVSSGVGQDFHKHIREVVGGLRADLATRWKLDDTARRFLDSASLYEETTDRESRVKKRLVLTLSDAAKRRLARHSIDSSQLALDIRDVTLSLFKTGHGFATINIEVARLDRAKASAAELLEAQILIGRFGNISWVDASSGIAMSGASFIMGQLIHRLALGRDVDELPERVTTYTYAQFAEPVPTAARDVFAVHLARHYTSDYVTSPDIGGVVFVADFETVRHAVALEGAATVVGVPPEAPDLPPFLRDFKTGTFRRHYVPIALLARHEHAFLVGRTSESVLSEAEMQDPTKTVGRLQELREASLIFRLCYRFSELSFVTMHNSLNRAFREVLHLDSMLGELDSDVAAVEEHLREVREAEDRRNEQARHRRFYWTTITGGAALAGLTAFTIVKEIGELFFHEASVGPIESHFKGLLFVSLVPGVIGAFSGLVVAIAAWFFAYLKGPGASEGDHGGHRTMHAMLDHMIERALK